MANAGMNPKALQYIMGHANITMTLDYYTHVDACSVKAEMERLAAFTTSVLRFSAKSRRDMPRYANNSPKRQMAETPENQGFATICRVT